MTASETRIRSRLEVHGLVQGVGFRPFVFGLANGLGLAGSVWNDAAGAVVDIEGPPQAVEAFTVRLPRELPPPGRVDGIEATPLVPAGLERFAIRRSRADGERSALVLADLATCPACKRELLDAGDRRHGYPFINCTHCGPRFTIIREVPYDRAATTMAAFKLCDDCRREYEDPTDRRFHAQPNACARCGPRLRLVGVTGEVIAGEPIERAAELLRQGAVLAIKGLGGYHLAVDARDERAVSLLRGRKHRDSKPFAVMVADVPAAAALAHVDATEAELLASSSAPIVLLTPRLTTRLAPSIAPGLPTLGVMLAYTPLHHLLLRAFGGPLVMTSGNLSDEPIAHDDGDAFVRLAPLVDALLLHDRPIERRCDDSVVRAWRGGPLPLRRSRGETPCPVSVPAPAGSPILAVGGHQKNTFCLLRDRQALLSHHIGDLENEPALRSYEQGIADLERLFDVTPRRLACDLHPDYLATQYARRRAEAEGLPVVAVQHHHAHLAACLADNGRDGEALGLILDGTGWGPDGTVWGGELLLGGAAGYRRLGRLRPFVLPGGSAAVRQGWRVALAMARDAGEAPGAADLGADPATLPAVEQLVASGFGCVVTSSAGRLFDAFSALAGVAATSRFEGQAAMLLEGAAAGRDAEPLPFEVDAGGELLELDWRPAVAAALARRRRGERAAELAHAFHAGLARGLAEVCERGRERGGPGVVALSGGCFQNVMLLGRVADALAERGFEVLVHRRVPPNDGGLSLGQAMVARADGGVVEG